MADLGSRQFSLRHLKHDTKVNNNLYAMLVDQTLVDVILSTDGTNIRAHRLILSANSSYFKTLFDSLDSNRCQIPIIILKDVPLVDLKAIIEFMYRGEVSVEERHLSSVLKSAELLKVNGLAEVCLTLRSRLYGESGAAAATGSTANTSNDGNTSASAPYKRPRISDGPRETPSQSSSVTDLFSNLSNARFEIRPTPSSSNTSMSNSPSNRSHSSNHLSQLNNTLSNTSARNCLQKSPNYSNGKSQQKSSTISKPSTWTPSQSSLSHNLVSNNQSSSCSQNNTSVVEVLLDDETQDYMDDEIDIKPPIFELNQRLAQQMAANSDSVGNEVLSSPRCREPNIISSPKGKRAKTGPKFDAPFQPSIKSRSSSTSSQSSLPPPPTYRVVQRSTSRLLRNIIKPTSMGSSSKGKDSDDKSKANARQRESIRLRGRTPKLEVTDESNDNSPEIECPSCGLAFNDEKKWNEHILTAHIPSHT